MNDYVTSAVFMLNYYDLGFLRVGLKSFVVSIDYRDYMGSSLETWLLGDRFCTWTLIIWSVLWQLASEQVQHYKCSVCVFKNKRVFKMKWCKSIFKLCQWSNPPCPYKDSRWLFKYWLGGFYLCIFGSTQVWMCDDRTMLPCGLMVEVAFICELATYVARFKFCNITPTPW